MQPSGNPMLHAMGGKGSSYFTDTASHQPNANQTLGPREWSCIYCITACTFTTLTCLDAENPFTTVAMTPGMSIYGRFTVVQLATGSVICYY